MRSTRFVVTIIAFSLLALIASGGETTYAQREQEESTLSNYFEHDDYEATRKWLSEYQNPEHLPNFEQIRYDGIQQLRAMPNPAVTRAALKATQSVAWMPAGISQTGAISGRAAAMDIDPSGNI